MRDDEGKRDLLTEDVIWKVLRGQGIREKNVKILGLACDRHHVRFADRWWVGRVFLARGAPTRCGRGSAGHVRGRARRGACGANFLDAHAWVAVRGAAGGIRDKGHPPQQFIYQPALEKVLASARWHPDFTADSDAPRISLWLRHIRCGIEACWNSSSLPTDAFLLDELSADLDRMRYRLFHVRLGSISCRPFGGEISNE